MRLKLFSKIECPFCWQVKIALNYLQVDYELKEWQTPDKNLLLQYSPQGTSPILLIDNFPIWDSVALMAYLEDVSTNNKTLFPGSTNERAKARLLHTYNNSIAGKYLREVIFEKRGTPESEWDKRRIEQGEQGWRDNLDWLENQIESATCFISAGFSVADAALLPRFGLAEHYGVGVDERHPKLHAWFNHLNKKNIYLETVQWLSDEITL